MVSRLQAKTLQIGHLLENLQKSQMKPEPDRRQIPPFLRERNLQGFRQKRPDSFPSSQPEPKKPLPDKARPVVENKPTEPPPPAST
jgi:hypothetical protein